MENNAEEVDEAIADHEFCLDGTDEYHEDDLPDLVIDAHNQSRSGVDLLKPIG
jgi:hypothetical protein